MRISVRKNRRKSGGAKSNTKNGRFKKSKNNRKKSGNRRTRNSGRTLKAKSKSNLKTKKYRGGTAYAQPRRQSQRILNRLSNKKQKVMSAFSNVENKLASNFNVTRKQPVTTPKKNMGMDVVDEDTDMKTSPNSAVNLTSQPQLQSYTPFKVEKMDEDGDTDAETEYDSNPGSPSSLIPSPSSSPSLSPFSSPGSSPGSSPSLSQLASPIKPISPVPNPVSSDYNRAFFVKKELDAFTNAGAEIRGGGHVYTIAELSSFGFSIRTLLGTVLDGACGENIGPTYKSDIIKDITNPEKKGNLDMVVVTANPLGGSKTSRRFFTELESNVMGILITEKNECTSEPNVHTIKLICASNPSGISARKNIGQYLMALYLFIIKRDPQLNVSNRFKGKQIGLLELADGYINTPGLCMYSKYNFKFDGQFYSTDKYPCFHRDNLPMYSDLTEFESPEQIVDVYMGKDKNNGMPKPGVCNIKERQLQRFVALAQNLATYVQMNFMDNIVDYTKAGTAFNYHSLWTNPELVNQDLGKLQSLIAALAPSSGNPDPTVLEQIKPKLNLFVPQYEVSGKNKGKLIT